MKETISKCDLCGKTFPENVKLMHFKIPVVSPYKSFRSRLQDFFKTNDVYADVCFDCLRMIRRLRKEEMEKENVEITFESEE